MSNLLSPLPKKSGITLTRHLDSDRIACDHCGKPGQPALVKQSGPEGLPRH